MADKEKYELNEEELSQVDGGGKMEHQADKEASVKTVLDWRSKSVNGQMVNDVGTRNIVDREH